jgi:hypothetical protein
MANSVKSRAQLTLDVERLQLEVFHASKVCLSLRRLLAWEMYTRDSAGFSYVPNATLYYNKSGSQVSTAFHSPHTIAAKPFVELQVGSIRSNDL